MKDGYKVTDIGEIPSNWEIVKWNEICEICYGKDQKKVEDVKGEYGIYGTGGLMSHSSCFLYNKPSVLIGRKGTIDKPFYLDKPFWTVDTLFYTKIKKDIVPKWFYYLAQITPLKKYNEATGVPSLSREVLYSIKAMLPPKEEQQKIASILSTVDEKIEVIEDQIKETVTLKKGLMQQLLTKGIGHTKFKDSPLGEIPESWEVIKIDDLLNARKIISHLDGNHGELYPKASEFVDEGIPYISANCFVNGKVDFKLCKKLPESRASIFRKGVAKNGDILFAHNATVGPVAYLETVLDYVILSTTATYYRVDNKTIDAKYWMYFLASNYFVNQYSKVMGQSTRNQVPITMQRSFLSILPNFIEQRKISEILITIDEKLETLLARKINFQDLKKGLMQQLLTGKMRVKI